MRIIQRFYNKLHHSYRSERSSSLVLVMPDGSKYVIADFDKFGNRTKIHYDLGLS